MNWVISVGKHEQKKPVKSKAKKSMIWIVLIVIAGIAAAIVLVSAFSGEEAASPQETLPVEQEQSAAIVDTEVPAVPTEEPTESDKPTEPEKPKRKELTVDSVEQLDNVMVVNTSYGTVRYPFAFSDLIELSAVNREEQSSLEWYVLIGQSKYPMFTIVFNGEDGELLGAMAVEADKPAEPVYMQFFPADDRLEGSDIVTVSAVQEILNDVIASLEDNETFTAAE